jgi:hypothetical protein
MSTTAMISSHGFQTHFMPSSAFSFSPNDKIVNKHWHAHGGKANADADEEAANSQWRPRRRQGHHQRSNQKHDRGAHNRRLAAQSLCCGLTQQAVKKKGEEEGGETR